MTMIVHVGIHKTASSWMQECFFIKKNGFDQILLHHDVYELIIKPDEKSFSPDLVKKIISDKCVQANAAGYIPVISSELLVGSPMTGARERYIIAERLKKVLPENSKIFIVLREQVAAIASIYRQHVKVGGVLSLKQFLCPPEKSYSYNWFSIEYFLYDRLISYYYDFFGKRNVSVLFYEQFKKDKTILLSALECANVSDIGEERLVNRSISDFGLWLVKATNRFYKSTHYPMPIIDIPLLSKATVKVVKGIDFLFNLKRMNYIDKHIEKHISLNEIKNSNLKMQEIIKMDLSSMGYKV